MLGKLHGGCSCGKNDARLHNLCMPFDYLSSTSTNAINQSASSLPLPQTPTTMDRRLHETILKGDTATFLNLIHQVDINDQGFINQTIPGSLNTVLHLAARLGHVELATEIVKLRPEMVVAVNDRMETPLYEACREGMVEIVKLLVEAEPGVVYKVNQDNETALFVACARGKLEVVNYLLDFQQLLMAEVDGSTSSLHVAASGGYSEIVKEILKVRPDFAWKKDQNGCTPLHLSCGKGHLEIARELLRLDADLSSLEDNDGRTPLHWAASKGRVNVIDEILSLSLESADRITKNGETVLHLAVKNNQFETVKYITEKLDVTKLTNRPDYDGNTVLHLATAGKLSAMVIYLIKAGVDVNTINRKGQTALDVIESDVSNSGALLILPALQNAEAKRSDQLPPSSSLEIQQMEHEDSLNRWNMPSSSPNVKKIGDSPAQHHRYSKRRHRREKQLEQQNEGLRNARQTIAVVAVLIATVAFSAGINPPGGFNQDTGKTIMGRQASFKVFLVCDVVALFLSLGIVIFLVSIIPFRRKSMMKLLVVTHKVMWLSMSFLVAAFIAAMWTIMPRGRGMVWVLAAVVSIGGGCTMATFVALGVLLARHWVRKWEWRRRMNKERKKKKKKKNESPTSSISRVDEMQMTKRGSRYSSSNSDVDSSDQGGYHLY